MGLAASDTEAAGPQRNNGWLWRRLPVAAMNAYRVVAFRSTITIGSYTLNIAEIVFTVLYIGALFI
jgi:ferric-chelate reductase